MAKASGRPVYLVDGARTPYLKARTGPGPFRASDLAVLAGQPLLMRQSFPPSAIDEVVLGCVGPSPDEVNIARVVALRLGLPFATPAWTVQRNCASGMQAIDSAAQAIAAGHAELVLAGGVEAMSHAPVLWSPAFTLVFARYLAARNMRDRARALFSLRMRDLRPVIALLKGLTDPNCGLSMGQTAEVLAARYAISRSEMDSWAVRSHQRLAAAQAAGALSEVLPLVDHRGKCYELDDGVRPDSSIGKLAGLKPVFDRDYGQITAGNSAQVSDGAAWVILASEAAVNRYALPVLARLVDTAWAGLDPREMGLGPVHATVPILKRQALGLEDIDLWEINEAFAAQVLACLRAFEDPAYCRGQFDLPGAVGTIDPERLNVDGGAIALGHPVGSSGARIVLHLAELLKRRALRRGIAALCIGGGQGGAMLIERT